MPVHQIAVVPARETASDGKSAPRSKDKSEGGKTAGRSGSRSSTISKASSSTTGLGAGSASRTSVTPSSQDICSSAPLPRVEEDAPEVRSHPKPVHMPARTSQSTNQSTATAQKKQVKRRHRRKRNSNATLDGVSPSSKQEPTDPSSKQEPTDLSSKQEPTDLSSKQEPTDPSSKQEPTDPSSKQEPTDRSDQSQSSEQGEKRERVSKPRRELPPRHRSAALPQPDTSEEEDERCRQSRSWSQEKARRGRHRSGSRGGGDDGVEPMELQSVGSDENKENQTPVENQAPPESEAGLKSRHGVGGPKEKKEGRGSLKGSARAKQREGSKSHSSSRSPKGSSSRSPKGSSSLAEDGEELITKRYKERGLGSGDMSVPSSRRRCSANVTAQDNSDDSELEVCRICHCEGDEECPLITPCFCTGSLRFVHQDCLNQWIKSSDTRCCELCKYNFIMETQLKPLRKWEKLEMTKNERRKIFCSVMFHLISVGCVLWSIYILVQRTAKEISLGKDGVLEWPFWTKLILVAAAFSGGLIFMYIQCKVYLQLWRRLKAFNRIITVQNCPENGPPSSQAPPTANGKHEPVEVPMGPMGNCGQAAPTDSDLTDDAAVAPEESPV